MLRVNRRFPFITAASAVALSSVIACSSSSSGGASPVDASTPTDAVSPIDTGVGPSDASTADASVVIASCTSPGEATPGTADSHCALPDGGTMVQPTSEADCHPDASDIDAGDEGCPYNATMFGQEGDDDDCKYHVTWTSTPLCEQTSAGVGAVMITVVATNLGDMSPLTGANTIVEFFTTTPNDASCDDMSTHPGANSGVVLTEGPPGTYTGPLYFDQGGAWTMRFHFHEECADILDDSPHGHAAFHLTLP